MTESFPRLSARTRRFTLGEPRSFTVCGDGARVLFLRSLSGTDPRTGLWCLDVAAGTERLVVDPQLAADEGELSEAERARRERVRETAAGVVAYSADAAGRRAVFAAGGALWLADVDSGDVRRLVDADGYDPRLDPTGSRVAYVDDRALHVVEVDGSRPRLLAGEADPAVTWGRAEFVAAEEMDRTRGFWWAPDGSALLAARVDESMVTTWWIADPAHPDRAPRPVRYPSAGSPNADVTLHVVALDGTAKPVDWPRAEFPYLARVTWLPDRPPVIEVQSRDQRTVQFRTVDVTTGATDLVAEDRDDVWVELFPGSPTWCGDRLVRIADVDGARRLVVGDDAVTGFDVYVRGIAGASDDAVVFTASTGDPARIAVLRWEGTGLTTLADGGVSAAVHAGPTTVVSTASLEYDGSRHEVRVTGRDPLAVRSLAEAPDLTPTVRLSRLAERRLPAGLVLPRDHVAGRKLPVLLDPYGGPHAQRVVASRRSWLEPQWWADQGFAVLVVDGRGTPGIGPDWERTISRDVPLVLDDQIDALHAAAGDEPDLDLSRVAIRGWSFGGYLAAVAVLRRPDVFHAAVAGAPVTEWTLYDTHYTERYLGTPHDDPAAYERASMLADAGTLSRPLLLIHGLADDNVVAANTLLLSQRLTEAGRPHTVLPLTGVTHMTPQETVAENLLLLQVDFLRRNLAAATG